MPQAQDHSDWYQRSFFGCPASDVQTVDGALAVVTVTWLGGDGVAREAHNQEGDCDE